VISIIYFKYVRKLILVKDFLLDPKTYSYTDPIFQRNQDKPVEHNNEYNTDLVAQKGLGFLDDAAKAKKPFFLTIAPIAPHADFNVTINQDALAVNIIKNPPIPAARHSNLYDDAVVPRKANFNPDVPSGVGWIAEQEQLSAENVTYNDLWYRQRLRSLAAIDEMVEQVIKKLEEYDILDNTYVVYSSDNGYHISQHRLQPGKGCGFEEDINVPLLVRGPGVPEGKIVDLSSSHTDLAPTFFKMLGIELRADFDGVPIPLTSADISEAEGNGKSKEHVQIEHWSYKAEGEYNEPDVQVNNTYKGLRIVSEEYGFYYAVWCDGNHQLYDMMVSRVVATFSLN
jgi:arylsulfatase A-like enzyme